MYFKSCTNHWFIDLTHSNPMNSFIFAVKFKTFSKSHFNWLFPFLVVFHFFLTRPMTTQQRHIISKVYRERSGKSEWEEKKQLAKGNYERKERQRKWKWKSRIEGERERKDTHVDQHSIAIAIIFDILQYWNAFLVHIECCVCVCVCDCNTLAIVVSAAVTQ